MRIGLFVNDQGFEGIDFNSIEKGNPGIGGTEFEFGLLSFYLSKRYDQVLAFHLNNNVYPIGCLDYRVENVENAFILAAKYKVDVFICNATLPESYKYADKYRVRTILWAHNFLRFNVIKEINKRDMVAAIVCVGDDEYKYTRLITNKAVRIYNMVAPVLYQGEQKKENIVTYIGALVPEKGFHILATVWPHIVEKVPDAKLYVIGSGNTYSHNKKLGRIGIASEEYEKRILKAFKTSGVIPSSVTFLGNMGCEKASVIKKTKVGVVNPTGRTETFGISALDFNGGVYQQSGMSRLLKLA